MAKSLVIVESPAKAKTISKILGSGFEVIPSMGHVVDLPRTRMGVDIEHNFAPSFIVPAAKKKILSQIKSGAKKADKIYLATDPDREGEAIAWNIKEKLNRNDRKYLRVIFHELTPQAIKDAFSHPGNLDTKKVQAQTGRRVLDRLVGYLLSPLLWRKIAGGLSAGRVQSVALRLIVEREREILKFVACEYWEVEAELKKVTGHSATTRGAGRSQVTGHFVAKLEKIDDKKAEIKNEADATAIVEDLKGKQFIVSEIKETEKKRNPLPPFITSTLQQDGFYKLRFRSARTMLIAQQLYEGIELGAEGAVGLITYMRTDSVNVAQSAIEEVRRFIGDTFGKEYLPIEPNSYKSRKQAQEAHEAIRPTSVLRAPDSIKEHLTKEQFKLYTLIYQRFIASQMKPAVYAITSVEVKAAQYLFRASGSKLLFKGFTAIYDSSEEKEEKNILLPLVKDETLELIKLTPSQHFTKPPPRFSEASLVKTLEVEGIGRPSTYAPTIQTIVYRDYVRRLKGYLYPTELGFKVNDLLVEYFAEVIDIKFTASMEDKLDEVEEGNLEWVKVINDFYIPFKGRLDYANEVIQKEVVTTDEICATCAKPMVVKWSRKGKFLSCSDFPACRYAKSITTGIKCPQEGCSGELIERRSRRGLFYGCTGYPKCTYIAKTLPEKIADSVEPIADSEK
ncbi:MAG: DNA topoisomerase I [Omnitrophica WOR_2 bacterium RIFCSPHIGHO2_02_FULL_45_21]|nr:MAG: DNA topoisomerase I [Omnitrophica WOR_2 bacterium RIFCSPHIGHO2_02_FULL_45_21]